MTSTRKSLQYLHSLGYIGWLIQLLAEDQGGRRSRLLPALDHHIAATCAGLEATHKQSLASTASVAPEGCLLPTQSHQLQFPMGFPVPLEGLLLAPEQVLLPTSRCRVGEGPPLALPYRSNAPSIWWTSVRVTYAGQPEHVQCYVGQG